MEQIKQRQILEDANTLVTLYNKINDSLKYKFTNPEIWQIACNNFWNQYNKLAFPGGLKEGLAGLKKNEPTAITSAIEFLIADPYYHRSGYNKKLILHLLKNIPLTLNQIKNLQFFLLNSLKKKHIFYLEYCRLARKIQDPEFKDKIEKIIKNSTDKKEVINALKMLNSVNQI